jgi:hypothetical protein
MNKYEAMYSFIFIFGLFNFLLGFIFMGFTFYILEFSYFYIF